MGVKVKKEKKEILTKAQKRRLADRCSELKVEGGADKAPRDFQMLKGKEQGGGIGWMSSR